MDTPQSEITQLLLSYGQGQHGAFEKLLPYVYAELRKLAGRYMRRERADHTFQPTALVHEAYLKLINQREVQWQNRAHFYGVAAQVMRRILTDHARAHVAAKRGGGALKVEWEDQVAGENAEVDLVALDEALKELAALDERKFRITELRYFGGLNIEETAAALNISPATVKREWALAKAWLHRALAEKITSGNS